MEKNFRFQQYSNSHFRVEGKNADHKTITHKFRISAPHGVTETILKRFQIKAAVARLIYDYRIVSRSERTIQTLIPDPKSRSMLPIGGIWVGVERRRS